MASGKPKSKATLSVHRSLDEGLIEVAIYTKATPEQWRAFAEKIIKLADKVEAEEARMRAKRGRKG
jgi:hypothetical protein